jgi:hypothetical protein
MRFLPLVLVVLAGCPRFEPGAQPPDGPGPDDPDAAPAVDSGTLAEVANALLDEWSGCLSLANFVETNMVAWANVITENKKCADCHDDGDFGFIATLNTDLFFGTITTDRFHLLQYFSVDLTAGAQNAKIIVNQQSFAGVASGQAPHQGHPTFDPANNAGMTALLELYDRTVARKVAAMCDPPRLQN